MAEHARWCRTSPRSSCCACANTNLSCELVADLLYVSPTQINFLVPDVSAAAYGQQALLLDAVLIRDGALFDTQVTVYVSPGGDFAVFQVGYDCDFSLSVTYPEACGYSPSSGQNRVPIGAVTDASGNLITSLNPIHQGQLIVLWATGLGALTLDSGTGEIARNVVESQRLSTPHRLRDRGSFRNRFLRNGAGHRGQQQRNLAMTDHLAELPLGDEQA